MALVNATLRAWPKRWLCVGIVLWAVCLGLLFGHRPVAAILPLRLVEIPEPRWTEVRDGSRARITVDGREREGTIVTVRQGQDETERARMRNERRKQDIVVALGVLSGLFGAVLPWVTYRKARSRASAALSSPGGVSERDGMDTT